MGKRKQLLKRFTALVSVAVMLVGVVLPELGVGVLSARAESEHTMWLVGDSTVCSFNDPYYYPRYGYGTQIGNYLDGSYAVNNLALSGRSSKTFLNESNYVTLTNGIKAGDVLVIGFGHNDEKLEAERYANPNEDYQTEGSFANVLYTYYVDMAQQKGAEVILCTPIVRLPKKSEFEDADLHIIAGNETYPGGDYAQAIRDLGAAVNVPVADLTSLTKELYLSVGLSEAVNFHAWTQSSSDSADHTHLNIYGAKMVAYMLAEEIAKTSMSVAEHVNTATQPTTADLVVNPDYVEPEDTDYQAPEKGSDNWPKYEVFWASALGDLAGNFAATNYTMETDEEGNMHMISQNNKGKIAGSQDGFIMYYYAVPAGKTFTLTATAKVNSIAENSQAAFGLMARDDMYIDTYDNTLKSDYVAAATFGSSSTNCFRRQDGTLTKGSALSAAPKTGDTYQLSIAYSGDGYSCTFGDNPTQSGGYDYQLTSVDKDFVYTGMFVSRTADITFSDITLIVDGEVVCTTVNPNGVQAEVDESSVAEMSVDKTIDKTYFQEEGVTKVVLKAFDVAEPSAEVQAAVEAIVGSDSEQYQVTYLDIKAYNNTATAGNEITLKDGKNITVTMPYPEDVTEKNDIKVLHNTTDLEVTKGENGFSFKADGFSPYTLVIKKTDPDAEPEPDEVQGDWKIYKNSGIYTAKFGDLGLTYYSQTASFNKGTSGGRDYVQSSSTNGSASNGIVVLKDKSYVDFAAPCEGTLSVYVGNASTKTGYASKTAADGTSTALGSFVPGGSDNVNAAGLQVTQGGGWATVDMETEAGTTYYVTVGGSKMYCYGGQFIPYTKVSGTITDPFNLGDYEIKFVNTETGESKMATVSGANYSVNLKAGTYSVALTGANAMNYAISTDTRNVTAEAGTGKELHPQTANLTIVESTSFVLSGTISGLQAGYSREDLKLVFVPEDTASFVEATAEITGDAYTVQLASGQKYTLKLVGVCDYKLSEVVEIFNATDNASEKNITLLPVDTYQVTGGFLGLGETRGQYQTLNVTPAEITFTHETDGYCYTGEAQDAQYSISLRDGDYLAQITADNYTTSTHVTVKGADVTRDLLLKPKTTAAVAYKDTVYVGADKEYKTVQAAVDAVTAMTRAGGERVTIMIDPGTYREQVVVNTPNITLESNGGNRDDTKITWYYGIGFKYYSCVDSYYDPYADYDQYDKGDVISYWGAAVITKAAAKGFRAEGIAFENSFNKYMTEEELTDGVEVNGKGLVNTARKENTKVDAKAVTERAAALVNYADQVEFKDCSFIGSQDTLYTTNVATDAYFKSCYIEGQTDFIFGNGDVIFDGCELNFCGYSGTASKGYLTANSCSEKYMATDGYIFRSCYISYNKERSVTPGLWGRMWGTHAKVTFINTMLQEDDMIMEAGWEAMSGVSPTSGNVTLVEYNTTYNGSAVSTAGRVAGVKDSIDSEKYSVEKVFIENGWTPAYYTAEDVSAPEFKTLPAFISNGDLNTPNPGETVTVTYELGEKWAENDTSLIAWYAVDSDYDSTSLDTILEKAQLLESTTAVSSVEFQIPMACAGKYLMAIVTPMTTAGVKGIPAYVIDTDKAVSSTWSDPDNAGSIAPGSGINIYLAGDSTVKDYSAEGIYNGGKILTAGSWGEYFQYFFNDSYVTVNNYAQGGRSSRSFINEGKLDKIAENIKEGDYLFVQFGHNDCSNGSSYYEERFCPLYTTANPADSKSSGFPTVKPTASMKTATPSKYATTYGSTYYAWDCGATYKGYLQMYIDVALEKGAIPVIVSPVARLYYDSTGAIKTGSHHDASMTDYADTVAFLTENNAYVTACRELYDENKDKGVLYIDAFAMTKEMYEAAYAAGGAAYGEAVMDTGDKTHNNKTGGVIEAGLLAKWVQDAGLSVSQYVIQPVTVYGEETTGEYIFTIKDSRFTAKDKQLTEQPYWSAYGQSIFDEIGEKASASEPTPTPTPTPEATPAPSPTPTPSATPTPEATPAPSPTPTPSAIPTPDVSPIPSVAPTLVPTSVPTTLPVEDEEDEEDSATVIASQPAVATATPKPAATPQPEVTAKPKVTSKPGMDETTTEQVAPNQESNAEGAMTYSFLEGAESAWTQESAAPMTFRVDAEFSKFLGVKVDDVDVDPAWYTAKSGSTIVSLKEDYLSMLENGTHTLKVLFGDGEAVTNFVIEGNTAMSVAGIAAGGTGADTAVAPIQVSQSGESIESGNSMLIIIIIAIIAVSAVVIGAVVVMNGRKED